MAMKETYLAYAHSAGTLLWYSIRLSDLAVCFRIIGLVVVIIGYRK